MDSLDQNLILRLPNSGDKPVIDWQSTSGYSKKDIISIENPNSESSTRSITSIPSPFARMHLFSTAFNHLVSTKELEGTTIYHRLVSECLDIAQLLFNIDSYSSKLEIIKWNKKEHLKELSNSKNRGHNKLSDTYRIFLEQDKKAFNFEYLDDIYILVYKGDNQNSSNCDVIGATSPLTLFFTPDNDLTYISEKLSFGNIRPFDGKYTPLHKRDLKFQIYFENLTEKFASFIRDKNPNQNDLAIQEYVELCSKQPRSAESNKKNIEIKDGFQDLELPNDEQTKVTIFNIPLQKQCIDIDNIANKSDFSIKPTKVIDNLNPLVLPIDKIDAYKEHIYINSQWDTNIKVPISAKENMDNRFLPGTNIEYSFLTIGDFLTDSLIRMPYQQDSKMFYDGNIDIEEPLTSYMLPIKPELFKYFSPTDLMTNKVDNEKMFEMINFPGSRVQVILRIPINNKSSSGINYITYKRNYNERVNKSFNRKDTSKENEGYIVEYKGTLALFPFLKYPKNVLADYRICLITDAGYCDEYRNKTSNFNLNFYNDNGIINETRIFEPNKTDSNIYRDEFLPQSKNYILKHNFDYIEVDLNNEKGLIIPKLKDVSGRSEFTFAIDFGTTNTHIEYKKDKLESISFDITNTDPQVQTFHILEPILNFEFYKTVQHDLLPFFINSKQSPGTDLSFPIRTCLSEHINIKDSRISFAETNIHFLFNKSKTLEYKESITDLKWSGDEEFLKRIKSFFENIIILIRNKVLLNGGDLDKTKIIWFYPISMARTRIDIIKMKWISLFKLYISENANSDKSVRGMSESLAPLFYYSEKKQASKETLCIDIGGGTTDILIPCENSFLTNSIRFGADSIFGDGFSSDINTNGFISKYYDKFQKSLTDYKETEKNDKNAEKDIQNLLDVLTDLRSTNRSVDIISFLFSLESILKKGHNLDYLSFSNALTRDNNSKYLFLLFYTAIIYHTARLTKRENLPKPRYIAFSGNGSNVIKLIDPFINKILKDYTVLIFEKVYGDSYNEDGLTLIQADSPKEATCKGGILSVEQSKIRDDDFKKITMLDFDNIRNIESISLADARSCSSQVKKDVTEFVKFFFDLDKDFSFVENFNIDKSVFSRVEKHCYRDIETFYKKGLDKRGDDEKNIDSDNITINENLMFIPLIETLNTLAKDLLINWD